MYWRRWWWWWWWYGKTVRHEAGLCLLQSPCDQEGWTGQPGLVLLIRQPDQPSQTKPGQAGPGHLQVAPGVPGGPEGGWCRHMTLDQSCGQRIDWLAVYSALYTTPHHTVQPTVTKERNGTLWTVMKDLTLDKSL